MIFSLDVRRARKGDCLLLHYGSKEKPGLVMIDGGPKAVYAPMMNKRPVEAESTVEEGVWDRRRRLVAAEIEQVALQLFAEKGYANVTTDDIARACNISARTLFRYFAAKRDLLLAVPRRSHPRRVLAIEVQGAQAIAVGRGG